MPHFTADREVDHSARQMLDLVADVEAYPKFVPLCEALKVRERRNNGRATTLITDMTVGYKLFRVTFTTRVDIDADSLRVTAAYLDGPFHHLDTEWRFEDRGGDRAGVHFQVDYAFKSAALSGLMGAAFSRAFRLFSDAFVALADQVYGRAGAIAE